MASGTHQRFLGGLSIRTAALVDTAVTVIASLDTTIYSAVDAPAADAAGGRRIAILEDAELRTGSIPAATVERKPAKSGGAFGSVRIPVGSFPAVKRWQRVHATMASCTPGPACSAAQKLLATIAGESAGQRFLPRLAAVNRRVNAAIRYVPDSKNYHRRDHWAEVTEIVSRRRGDCEDYAILKMAALVKMGMPERSMSVVVLYDRGHKAFHAVLAVATDQGNFILDNVRDDVYLDSDQPDYQPLYSLGDKRAWVHGTRVNTLSAFSDISDFDAIAPGEGVQAN